MEGELGESRDGEFSESEVRRGREESGVDQCE